MNTYSLNRNRNRKILLAHSQMKNATQLYTKLLVRALSHTHREMQLAAIIAIAEGSIDNLIFQMKVIFN